MHELPGGCIGWSPVKRPPTSAQRPQALTRLPSDAIVAPWAWSLVMRYLSAGCTIWPLCLRTGSPREPPTAKPTPQPLHLATTQRARSTRAWSPRHNRRIWPKSGRIRAMLLEFGWLWRKSARFGRHRPTLGNLVQIWSDSAKFGRVRHTFVRNHPKFGHHLPRLAEICPNLVETGRNLAETGHNWSTSGSNVVEIGGIWPKPSTWLTMARI